MSKYKRNKEALRKEESLLDETYKKYGLTRKKKPKLKGAVSKQSNYTPRQPNLPELSNKITKSQGIVDYHMRLARGEETQETLSEIEKKKTRTAPLYSKGPTQYVTPGSDLTEVGKKI